MDRIPGWKWVETVSAGNHVGVCSKSRWLNFNVIVVSNNQIELIYASYNYVQTLCFSLLKIILIYQKIVL